ncbi:DUF1254 domain-containing protein [Xanthobacter tagetidis]|uniref:DUF1254 domain-containing protein n=1 Tax=Xanthobacter tagetidis TaxID=60216 RepID=A0A3L7A7I5_9HYPH|nr:DUF1254 domain-containing protein [Xanthobacter tagetidis]RLP75800.1 DUF1254 domain-containing protein [Xanthobacter tagetidis]
MDAIRDRRTDAGPLRRRLGGLLARIARWPAGLLLSAAVAVVLAGIAHIISILAMPALAERNAYARLSELAESNMMVMLPDPTPQEAVLPMTDPAFISAVCLYDLSQRPVKVRVPATSDYTSVSFYTAEGLAFYALSDQAAGAVIELDLMTAAQKAALPEDEEITAADRLVIVSPSVEGVVMVRAFVRERGMRAGVRKQLEAAGCGQAS